MPAQGRPSGDKRPGWEHQDACTGEAIRRLETRMKEHQDACTGGGHQETMKEHQDACTGEAIRETRMKEHQDACTEAIRRQETRMNTKMPAQGRPSGD